MILNVIIGSILSQGWQEGVCTGTETFTWGGCGNRGVVSRSVETLLEENVLVSALSRFSFHIPILYSFMQCCEVQWMGFSILWVKKIVYCICFH